MAKAKTYNYIALLRGINVGGNNIIKMKDLAAAFTELGFTQVQTYIQSGNVVFQSHEKQSQVLRPQIEDLLSQKFAYAAKVCLVSQQTLEKIVEEIPPQFGENPQEYRYDVFFLLEPLTPEQAISQIEAKEGVDQTYAGRHALYFSRLIEKASQSKLNKLIQKPIYKSLTIRNWNTTAKLLQMVKSLD